MHVSYCPPGARNEWQLRPHNSEQSTPFAAQFTTNDECLAPTPPPPPAPVATPSAAKMGRDPCLKG